MRNAIKQSVTVQRGGARIEVFVPELKEGTTAEVIVRETAREDAATSSVHLAEPQGDQTVHGSIDGQTWSGRAGNSRSV